MVESCKEISETGAVAEKIGGAFKWWLDEEIKTSMSGSNAFLDYRDEKQFLIDGQAKSHGHYDRLEKFIEQFSVDPSDKEVMPLLLFGAHTGLTGAFRTDCFVLNATPESYTVNRSNGNPNYGPLNIDIDATVNNRLEQLCGRTPSEDDLAKKVVDPVALVWKTQLVNTLRLRTIDHLTADWKGFDTNKPLHRLAHHFRLVKLQREWLRLGVDLVLHSAYLNNGKLEDIEFLEPKTFNKAEVYLPFADN